jgi:cell pole-organizing protein PopZ
MVEQSIAGEGPAVPPTETVVPLAGNRLDPTAIGERLLSDATAGAAAAAFAQLAAVRRKQRRAAEFLLSSVGSTTLEDVVLDMVRPMLGGYLDEKLPEMIDRLVQAEIARLNDDVAA